MSILRLQFIQLNNRYKCLKKNSSSKKLIARYVENSFLGKIHFAVNVATKKAFAYLTKIQKLFSALSVTTNYG